MGLVEHDFVQILSLGGISLKSSPLDEIAFISKGMSVGGLKILMEQLGWRRKVMAEALSLELETLELHLVSGDVLPCYLTEQSLEIARLASKGAFSFGGVTWFNTWLNSPNIEFAQQTPFSVINTIRGRAMAERVMLGLDAGVVG